MNVIGSANSKTSSATERFLFAVVGQSLKTVAVDKFEKRVSPVERQPFPHSLINESPATDRRRKGRFGMGLAKPVSSSDATRQQIRLEKVVEIRRGQEQEEEGEKE